MLSSSEDTGYTWTPGIAVGSGVYVIVGSGVFVLVDSGVFVFGITSGTVGSASVDGSDDVWPHAVRTAKNIAKNPTSMILFLLVICLSSLL